MNKKLNEIKFYIKFIWVFALLGLQMIGNFSALMPILEDTLAEKRKWIKKEDVLDSITWGRCGPGAAVINSMVYLGNPTIILIKGTIFIGYLIVSVKFKLESKNNL